MLPIWAFVAVTIPLVLTPGVSTAVVLRNSIAGGTRAGVLTAVGINGGSLCYGVLTAFGFAFAIRRWPSTWVALRAAGSAYLAWLAVRSLRAAWSPRPSSHAMTSDVARSAGRHLSEGFLTNALNPSIATFYLIVVPQFIPRESPVVTSALLLSGVHIGLAFTWHLTWAAAGGTLAPVLIGGRPRRLLDLIAGATLLALAVAVAYG